MATSELEGFADDSVAWAMKRIFSQEIYHLDIADGSKQLLYKKKYDSSHDKHGTKATLTPRCT